MKSMFTAPNLMLPKAGGAGAKTVDRAKTRMGMIKMRARTPRKSGNFGAKARSGKTTVRFGA